jgi:hypothetical protein
MPISDELLSILVCPQCKKELTYDRTAEKLICAACGLRYAIVDDIPDFVEGVERIESR